MSATAVPPITPEEYLARDRAAEFRSEYFDGRMYAMSGGTRSHASIASNVLRELGEALKGTGCEALGSDVRLRIPASGLYTYPDVVVSCGESLIDGEDDLFSNPIVIVEVLLKSTEAYDRGFKFAQYRMIELLQEYVLISQTEPLVEIFRRQPDGEFKLSECAAMDRDCHFASIGCRVPMTEIYRNVRFPPTPAIRE